MSRTVAFLVASLLGAPVYAQDKTAAIDQVFGWTTPDAPGCVVAVSHHGKLVVNRAYGLADIERNIPLAPETVFDAGSLRKQFVAATVLILVEEGRISLSDDIRKFIPELPDYGSKITVDHLLTHTSGLRDWPALLQMASGDPTALSMILRQRALNFAPGDEWSYSNSGYVLLPMIVERASGMKFADFVRKRLFEPLGMKLTTYVADMNGVTTSHALAYQRDANGWKPDMLIGNARGGAGALATTASDLVIWSDALKGGRLGAFVTEKLQEPARLNNGRKLTYARGLFVETNRGGKFVWHTGSANAFKALTSFYPDQDLSIGIMCNAGDGPNGTTLLARRIFDVFVPATVGADASAPAPVASAPGIDVTSKVGLFLNESTGEPLRLITNSGRLGIALGGPLVAVTSDRFRAPRGNLPFMSQDEFELNFLSPDRFELKSMEGKTTWYRRAKPYAPTALELAAFAGRYESDELMAAFHVVPGPDALMIRINDMTGQGAAFKPVDPDTYQNGNVLMRFRRDAAGKVVELDMTNPVLRRVTFTRGATDGR